jgi:YfiH family protein
MVDTKLPQPSDSFRWTQAPSGPALVCTRLELFARHLVTTAAWKLGAGHEDGWSEVAEAISVPLARARQVHGAEVLVHRVGEELPVRPVSADIIVTNDPGVAPAIQTADCVPLLLVDRRTGVVAAAHAGWRGLAARVPGVAVDALARVFGSGPTDLLAALGPSIRACCYEVGADVVERFEAAGWQQASRDRWFAAAPRPTLRNPSMPRLAASPRPDRWYFDSAVATRDQLESAGVPAIQIFDSELCTASHPGVLCSYRRDGSGAGRLAAVIRAAPSPPRP